jgi:hypothetical protein
VHPEPRIDEATCCEVPDHVLARRTGAEMVVLNLDNEQYYGLDEVGTRFWDLVAAGGSFGAAVSTLLEEYEVERAVLVDDLTSLIDDLSENGLVTIA